VSGDDGGGGAPGTVGLGGLLDTQSETTTNGGESGGFGAREEWVVGGEFGVAGEGAGAGDAVERVVDSGEVGGFFDFAEVGAVGVFSGCEGGEFGGDEIFIPGVAGIGTGFIGINGFAVSVPGFIGAGIAGANC